MINSVEKVREGIDEWLEHDIDYVLNGQILDRGIQYVAKFEVNETDYQVQQYVSYINAHMIKITELLYREVGHNMAGYMNAIMEAQHRKEERNG